MFYWGTIANYSIPAGGVALFGLNVVYLGLGIFFFLSGNLIFESLTNDRSVGFLARRILRIWPALAVTVLVVVLFVGPIVSSLSLNQYASNEKTIRYFANLLFITQHDLPGVFEANPYPLSSNGSIWSIPLEFMLYLGLWLLVWVVFLVSRRLRVRWQSLVIITLSVLSFISYLFLTLVEVPDRFQVAIVLCITFAWGAVSRAGTNLYGHFLFAGTAISTTLLSQSLIFLTPLLAALMVIPSTKFSLPMLRRFFEKLGDLSYGIFLVHWPVSQTLIYLDSSISVIELNLLSIVLSSSIAYISWRYLEKPCIQLGRKLSQSTR